MPIRELLNVLMPSTCRGCGVELSAGEDGLCLHCVAHLPRTHYTGRGTGNPVEERFAGRIPFERAAAWLQYTHDSAVSSLIQDFKYRKMPSLAERMGELMALELLPTGFFSDVDTVIPTPQHWTRRMRRGYNQTEYIAEGVAKVIDAEVKTNLRALRMHRSQTKVSGERRRDNTKGVYGIKRPEELEGRHILLVDDVCTTGATLLNCAKALYGEEYGIKSPDFRLSILALAAVV